MTKQEQIIIDDSIDTALSFGLSFINICSDNLQDYGYKLTPEHEQYIFNKVTQ